MLLMFERGIRGGITQSVNRWAKAHLGPIRGPFMCERMKINGVERLIPNLFNKKRYVIHIRALDQALKHGTGIG